MLEYLREFENTKTLTQMKFEEMVGNGSYYCSGAPGATITTTMEVQTQSTRGVRGPMDRYLGNENDDGGDVKMTPAIAKEHRNQVCLDIGRCFFENGLSFNVAKSVSFANMLRSVANYGRGLKPPSMHELRTWILNKEEETTSQIVDDIKSTWKKTGVSILSDGRSDMRNRSLINFLVNNPHGTVFLKTVDASDCVKDAKKLFELLDGVVEEIGEDIVVQVVTDNASAYKAAGGLLMKKRTSLYWTLCAAHCIDLMLEKIGELPQHKSALQKAKRVSNFIYNHQYVLSHFRKIAKKDLLRPAATRFATAFFTLESMLELKQALQTMFVSREWSSCAWAKKSEGKTVKKIVMDDRIFWPSVVYSIKTTQPLVQVIEPPIRSRRAEEVPSLPPFLHPHLPLLLTPALARHSAAAATVSFPSVPQSPALLPMVPLLLSYSLAPTCLHRSIFFEAAARPTANSDAAPPHWFWNFRRTELSLRSTPC